MLRKGPGIFAVVAVAAFALVTTAATYRVGSRNAATPDDQYELWITNQARNSVQVLRDEEIVAEITLDPSIRVPHIVRFSPSGRFAYLASVGLPGAASGVTVIRSEDRQPVATLLTGPGTHEAKPTADGSRVLVSVGGTRQIIEVTADESNQTFGVSRVLSVSAAPLVAAAGLEGQPVCIHQYTESRAYVGFHHGGAALLDLSSLSIVRAYSKAEVGPNRCAMLPLADGRLLVGYGSLTNGGYAVWDPGTESFLTTTETAQIDNHGGALRPRTNEAWFVARGSDTLTVGRSAAPYDVIEIVALGDAPDHLVFSPNGRWAFVVQRGPEPLTGGAIAAGQHPGLAMIDAASRTLKKLIDLGGGDPHWIALRPLQ